MKTLIVDDNIANRVSMQKIMAEMGENRALGNGFDAINDFEANLFLRDPYDLILLDIVMPDINGVKVLNQIRKIEEENNIPKENRVKILMVTSHSQKDIIVTCLKAGCNGYIVKPFKRDVIIKKLFDLDLPIPVKSLPDY